ncbi:MAG: hypothetical protein QXL94_00385 [Candidatus Parvarchaeum sp.]
MPYDAKDYLDYYRPQIEKAIRLSYLECVEYAYIKPVEGNARMIQGGKVSVSIPNVVTYGANMLFHTHPSYTCIDEPVERKFQEYITRILHGFFSDTDLYVLFQRKITVGLLAAIGINGRASIRSAVHLSPAIIDSYSEKLILFGRQIITYAEGRIPIDNPALVRTTTMFHNFINTYTPIIETIDLNL